MSCFDPGGFSIWVAALRKGVAPEDAAKLEWSDYYEWLEPMIWHPGRWAIIPDIPAAPSQLNDGLMNDWRFGRSKGVPVWHMDGPIARLGRLCEQYDRVCLGWIGDPKREPVGCDAYRRRMDEVAALMGNTWHPIHMLRGIAVAFDYPFVSADSTSLAQNGWRYDTALDFGDPWAGRQAYADALEGKGPHADRRRRNAQRGSPQQGRHGPRSHLGDNCLVLL